MGKRGPRKRYHHDLHILLDQETWDRLEDYARKTPMSQMGREALERYLDHLDEKRKRKERV